MLRRAFIGLALVLLAPARPAFAAAATASGFSFTSIDGGQIALGDFAGGPVLVVNTASRCGFTDQYDALQEIYQRYEPRGLTVIGVSSNSFRQELGDEAAVKEFCEVNFSITFPITAITPVTGANAHPFYAWAREQGVVPSWNFNKILIDGQGRLVASYGATMDPRAPRLLRSIEALLPAE